MKPDCYKCVHRHNLEYDAHSCCWNIYANVEANKHGIKNNWCYWPMNFDPTWIDKCDGFSECSCDIFNKPTIKYQLINLMRFMNDNK